MVSQRLSRFSLTMILLLSMLVTGCSALPGHNTVPERPTLLSRVDIAADRLVRNAHGRLSPSDTIIATTFVDVDQLGRSSTLGRTLTEAMTSKLVEHGLNVIEVKLRDSLYIEEYAGEMILSRNVQRLGNNYNASAVLLGTYAVARGEVFVNARLVRLADQLVLGASSFRIPMDADVQMLLTSPY
ncbi:FlgO family outer membrane protein [uncultured Kushneria sp.]|uniref:FlgO family outer membrane protein n=1 Tax=uncultured Kushneria sp. TaxID=905033 RepID=UPI00261074F6|nr:FlgO family outer membrane protein [uncultured Kushneria sp.]